MLNIIVCIKVVTDPEAPTSTFKIDSSGRHALPGQGVPPVLNPYDENALEAALRIKTQQQAKITVISAGKSLPKAVIKKSLAVGADELVLVEDGAMEETDSYGTAFILAAGIKKLGIPDIVITGRMASDTNAGQVGAGLAELLGIPLVTVARKIDISDNRARVECVRLDGYEIVTTSLPCLVTISHELGELRQATIKGLMAAQKQPFTTWKITDLDIQSLVDQKIRTLKLYVPEKQVICEFMPGDTPEEVGSNLAVKLRDCGGI